MRRVILLLFVGLIGSYHAFAQWADPFADNHQKAKIATGMYGNADFGSNCITSQFAYDFAMGNYLDSNLKRSVASELKKNNRLGYNLNFGIYAVLYNDTIRDKRIFNFFFALRHKSYFNASFTNDDYNLAFFGNASYAGKTAMISPMVVNSLSYQQAEVGFVCTNFGGNSQFGAGFSFLAGQQYTSFNAENASLYTDPLGQSLLLNTEATVWQSDTSKGYMNRLNGIGGSMDVYFRAPYKLGKKEGTVTVSVNDIGFIKWDNHSLNYQKDTTYMYNGINISSLTDLQNANFNSLSKDSLKNKYFPFSKQSFYAAIPTLLSISTNTILSEKFHLEMGYWNLFNANAIGYIYAQGDFCFHHGYMVCLQAGYGGYNTINGALLFSKQFKCSKLELAINHLPGIIMPTKYGGAGAYASYVLSFGK